MRSSASVVASARRRSRSRSISARSDTQLAKIGGELVGGARGGREPRRRAGWRCGPRRARPPAGPGSPAAAGGPSAAARPAPRPARRAVRASEARSAASFWRARRAGARCPAICGLEVLDPLAGLDQRLVERRAVLVERVDLGAELGVALLGEGDVARRPRRVRPAARRARRRPPLLAHGRGRARRARPQARQRHRPSLA